MNNKHRKTLQKVMTRPPLASIPWKDIESLIKGLGGIIEEGEGSRVHLLLNNEAATFHRPHPHKETDKGAVVSMQRFLALAGITDDDL
ncbi:MAG: type II toxin-antitoxin system HicA family toxin [Pseudomonadota bacterium]